MRRRRSGRWKVTTGTKPLDAEGVQRGGGAFLDEPETRFGLGAHERVHRGTCRFGVLDHLDAQESAVGRIHGGFLELLRQHFAKTLEAADFHFASAIELGLEQFVLVRIGSRIKRLSALADAVKRRHRHIKVALPDEVGQFLMEESDQ